MQRSILDENISDTETLIEALPSPIQPVKLPEDQSTLVTNDIGTITQKKRLIVCCDGAWELSNSKSRIIPYSDTKLPRVSRSFYVENGKVGTQMVYYDAGLKTALPTDRYAGLFWRVRGAKGLGQDGKVYEAYRFLVQNYSEGDEISFFGFSQGAYTAQTCADLVAKVGICAEVDLNQFWEMYAMFKAHDNAKPLEETAWGQPPRSSEWTETISIVVNDRTETVSKSAGALLLSSCRKHVDIKAVEVLDYAEALDKLEKDYFDSLEALSQVTEVERTSCVRRGSLRQSLLKRRPSQRPQTPSRNSFGTCVERLGALLASQGASLDMSVPS